MRQRDIQGRGKILDAALVINASVVTYTYVFRRKRRKVFKILIV